MLCLAWIVVINYQFAGQQQLRAEPVDILVNYSFCDPVKSQNSAQSNILNMLRKKC